MPTSDLPVVDGYVCRERIGSGGSSRVYRATQEAFARDVALKVLSADMVTDEHRNRFTKEALALGPVSAHPNIVTVLDAGVTRSGEPYLALELFEQGTYAERVRSGPIPIAEVLRTGVKIASALETAHQHGLIHKDIKPENILISRFGEPALADFGVASFIGRDTTSVSGLTIRYAPPELLEDETATTASDLYSLGATLYAFLAGRPPFDGPNMLVVIRQITEGQAPPILRSDLPTSLGQLIYQMLAKEPHVRPSSAAAVVSRLQAIEDELRVPRTAAPMAASPADRLRNVSVVEDRTVARPSARTPPPLDRASPVSSRGRSWQWRRGVRWWAPAAALMVIASAAIAVALFHTPDPPRSSTSHGPTTAVLPALEALPPSDITLVTRGNDLIAAWTHATATRFAYTTSQAGSASRATNETTAHEVVVAQPAPGERWCITIVAVLATGERSQPSPARCS